MVVLPGTKNTMEDLLWMRQCGLEAAILKLAAQGTPVFGICGGYQMLGKQLNDPLGVEHGGSIQGMGLLPTVTTFSAQKTRTQVSGITGDLSQTVFPELSHTPYTGYEIHMGVTQLLCDSNGMSDSHKSYNANDPHAACTAFGVLEQRNGTACQQPHGCCVGNVFGSYLHGIFDHPQMVKQLVAALCRRKGLDAQSIHAVDFQSYKEQQYDLLAKGVRESLDMEQIYRILQEGI